MKKLLFRNRNLYAKRTFIRAFSYSVIISLCVLLLTLFALYFSFRRIVTSEIHNRSIELLVQSQSVFNSLHEWIIPSFRQIKSEAAISTLIYSGNPDKMEMSAGFDRLQEILASYYLVDSIYVYNYQTGSFFSTINGYEGAECSDESILDILNNIRHYGVYRYIPRRMTYRISNNVYRWDSAKVKTTNVFTIVVGDIPESGSAIRGALIVNISARKVSDHFFPAYKDKKGELVVTDKNGRILLYHDDMKFAGTDTGISYIQSILNSGKEEGVFQDTIGKKKYLVSYITHPVWGWKFIYIAPYQSIYRNLTDFLIVMAFVFVLLMILSVALAYFTSKKVYSPVHKLFQYARNLREEANEGSDSGNGKRISEIQYVDQVFKQIIADADSMSDTLEKNQEIHRSEILKEFILGELNTDDIEETYREYIEKELGKGPFVISILRLDNFKALADSYKQEKLSQIFTILKGAATHYMPGAKYFLKPDPDHLCVISGRKSGSGEINEYYKEIKEALKRIQGMAESQLDISITVGLSEQFDDYTLFNSKYTGCLHATDLRFRFGPGWIISADIGRLPEQKEYVLPEQRLSLLFKELSLGKISRVEQILGEVFEDVKNYSLDDFRFLIQFVTYQSIKYIERIENSLNDSVPTLKDQLQHIRFAETVDEAGSSLMETYTLIFEIVQKKKSSKLEELARNIQSYMEENYRDCALCTDSISDKMGVTAYYSRFAYKKIFGVSLYESLNSMRLEYCRNQLTKTKLPIKKIYTAAGFTNYSYFFTLFKKYTGLTPKEFRQQRASES